MENKICRFCGSGYVVNGVCNRCGKTQPITQNRRSDALPLNYRLHNRYILGEVLGWGGFGITYSAWDTKQNCAVAVKELYPSSFVTRVDGETVIPKKESERVMRKMKESFSAEAMMLIKLQDLPGIIKIFHAFDDNNTIYFSMELLQGEDLKTYLKTNRTVKWDRLSEMMRPILSGVDALHQRGIIHRDISPDNIFICSDGTTRLIDFGLARKFDGDTSFTVTLKECFAPWEQYDSHGRQGPWTDVYAMGVTLYVALSGVLPPIAPDRVTNAKQTAPLADICPSVPRNVAACIDKAMSIKIEDRYESMGRFYTALFGKETHPADNLPQKESVKEAEPKLVCLQGALLGRSWPLRSEAAIRIGRGISVEIKVPQNTHGVSKLQCTLMLDKNGIFLLRDEGSSYGTIVNGVKIKPNMWYSLLKGSWIMMGQQIFQIQ